MTTICRSASSHCLCSMASRAPGASLHCIPCKNPGIDFVDEPGRPFNPSGFVKARSLPKMISFSRRKSSPAGFLPCASRRRGFLKFPALLTRSSTAFSRARNSGRERAPGPWAAGRFCRIGDLREHAVPDFPVQFGGLLPHIPDQVLELDHVTGHRFGEVEKLNEGCRRRPSAGRRGRRSGPGPLHKDIRSPRSGGNGRTNRRWNDRPALALPP